MSNRDDSPISVYTAKSAVMIAVAAALGKSLILGIDNAAEEGRPLTQLQQIDLAVMSHQCFDVALEICESLEVESAFSRKVWSNDE